MRTSTKLWSAAAATAALASAHGAAAAAKANGEPQRSDEAPPGLLKAFAKGTPGIMNAIVRTQGSNSRLQDLPQSP